MAPKSNCPITPNARERYWNAGAIKPLYDQRVRRAERIQHVERRRMERRGARLPSKLGARFKHRDRHVEPCKVRGSGKPDWACARDQHALVDRHGDLRARY